MLLPVLSQAAVMLAVWWMSSAAPSSLLPAFTVVRTGRAFVEGDSVSFPGPRTRAVNFGPRIREGRSLEDGYLDTARSTDGRRLWVRSASDDGDVSSALFELDRSSPLPTGAVLQMVDGFTSPDPSGEPGGFGSSAYKHGTEIRKQHFEAWVALPEAQAIVRPADQARYPLVSVVGKYDANKARRAQWVVFVSRCKETDSACVYYGPPVLVCARSSLKGEADGLHVFPWRCPSPP